MREPSNISKVVALQPDFIGLIFYPKSKRFVEDLDSPIICSHIPQTIKKVGVFVNAPVDDVIRRIKLFNLETVQLHGEESPEYCRIIKNLPVQVIKAFGMDETFEFPILDEYQESCDYFLFDTKSIAYGGSGQKYDWNMLKKYANSKPYFLSGGIGPKSTNEIITLSESEPYLFAVDLNSKFEISPALKDEKLLADFLNSLQLKITNK